MNTNLLYGAIGGDIIGSCFERNNIKSKEFTLFRSFSHVTDDSVMTIATAEALLTDRDYKKAFLTWGRAYSHAGYGGQFMHWLHSDNPQPYNSWGNGSAMRVSPVALAMETEEDVLREAEASAAVTHNHPEGIKGAQAAALAVFMARTGASKEDIRQAMEDRFQYDVSSFTLDEIRPKHFFDVSCQGTLPVAIRAFLESEDYEDAVRNAISIGGDSDTIAAITGGIALAFYGNMPEAVVLEIESRLPPDMKELCDRFARRCWRI